MAAGGAYRESVQADAPESIEIPTDAMRAGLAAEYAHVDATLDPATTGKVRALASRHDVEASTVLLAAWLVLVRRLSGQAALAMLHAGSAGPALPLRFELPDELDVTGCLRLVATAVRAARASAGESVADAGHRWQVSFADREPADATVQGSELAMSIVAAGDGHDVRLAYDRALFQPDTARRHLVHWRNLLQSMLADDGADILCMPMLDADERKQVLEEFNDTAVAYPHDVCLHGLVEAQVARTPDAIAVAAEDRSLTFAELNAAANRLAHHLRAQGVRPDDRVGICIERGWRMVVGLLAILKSGGAYVPMDPSYPADRLAHMLGDSAPKVLLIERKLRPLLEELQTTCPLLDLDDPAPVWDTRPDSNPDPDEVGLSPRDLVYVIYTSGSTGLPKGAMVEHRSVVNRMHWLQQTYALDASDAVLQKAPVSFDASVTELFWPLAQGARLVLARPGGHKEPAYLARTIVRQKVTTCHFVPSMLQAFLEEESSAACAATLRRVMCGGEALNAALAEHFHRLLPGVGLFNQYGPTETTITVTFWPCQPGTTGGGVPIGRPIANTRLYLLDANREPVPRGVAGELYVGGVQVARGYLNRDDLTAERFLPDPFVDGGRMYRTGDLGRWRADGSVEYLGRNDLQVKVRGFRIELGEIESRLLAHPGVAAAAAAARRDDTGEARLVAYYVPRDGAAISVEAFREHLSQALPEHMIPAAYVKLGALPISPSGKLDRRALPEPGSDRPELAVAFEAPVDDREAEICAAYSAVLGVAPVGRHDNFFDLGGSSLLAVQVLERLRRTYTSRGAAIDSLTGNTFFRRPTPASLAVELEGGETAAPQPSRMARARSGDAHRDPIAIIAMAGRFPGAADVEGFWQNLCEGRDSITHFGPDGLDPSIAPEERNDPAYVPARGIIEDLDKFDAAFFGIGPREAELMDPQQRIFLELCWECLERGGYAPDATPGPVGVFAGTNHSTYLHHHVFRRPDLMDRLSALQLTIANDKGFVATRVAHKLNLTGPAMTVHTSCSTSLVAICQAVDSLRAGRCDMALAGAASATCPPRSGYRYQEGAMLSPDGRTRAFDVDAEGTVFSDGAAVVLLKRLSDALADGDNVIALVRGGAVNNDGGNKASYTAPSSEGQATVIAMAHADAGVSPRDVSYVEAHGTATPMGDPIEIEGMTHAFRLGTGDTGFCRIGSLKSNVGHLIIAAGAAGVIKTACALQQECIPATIHFRQPNPAIDFASSPFVVNDCMDKWPRVEGRPRLAGVSSFGVGGTNAHVVMEEAPVLPESESGEGPQLLALSARTPAALAQAAQRLAAHLEVHPRANLADVAWTLAAGRKAFAHRVGVVAGDAAEAVRALRDPDRAAAIFRGRAARAGGVVFLFPGQGSQYAGMGRELYEAEPAFREAFDACIEGLRGKVPFDLRDLVFGDDADALLPTSVMQPAIFSIEYALGRWWMAQGIQPAAMLGHSIGEFVAATLSGVFVLEDGLRLVARRGQLMQAQPAGSMLSVRLSLQDLDPRLPADLSLAAENAPGACVVAGPTEGVARFQAELEQDGVACRLLRTSHAFHSAMMDPVVEPFRREVASVRRSAPNLPLVSTATGDWLDASNAMSEDYWARHLREAVRFSPAVARVIAPANTALLEVGTRTTLASLARQQSALRKHQIQAISSLADAPENEVGALRDAVGQLWACGAGISPSVLDRRRTRRKVVLPTYPFERKSFWVDAVPAARPGLPLDSEPANSVLQPPELRLVPGSEPAQASETQTESGRDALVVRARAVLEDAAGFEVPDEELNFIEQGLDSLMLTQVALRLQKEFGTTVTFRQLMGDCSSLARLADHLHGSLPAGAPAPKARLAPVPEATTAAVTQDPAATAAGAAPPLAPGQATVLGLVEGQLAVMRQQLALLSADMDAQLRQQVLRQQHEIMLRQVSLLAGNATAATTALALRGEEAPAPITPFAAEGGTDSALVAVDHVDMDSRRPPVPGARLGRDPDGRPGWYVQHPEYPDRYLQVAG